jgi:dTDP-4-amino-4,6-dideoxygalactose transaminase
VTVANAGGYGTTAILAAGAEPAFADIDDRTLLIDPATIPSDAAAIIVTHLYGRMADMEAILTIAGRIPVIEDCAQAHGARLHGRPAGSWGTAGCFSFYPTKNLGAAGDAGAVVTSDPAIAERVRLLRQYGWKERYKNSVLGAKNSRLDEIQAAFLLDLLPHLDSWNARRRSIATRYTAELAGLPLALPPAGGDEYVAHLYIIKGKNRDLLRQELASRGIGTDIHYPVADYRQPAWAGLEWAATPLPRTDSATAQVLTIPCFPELTDEEATTVILALRAAVVACL